jgi:hypothetical protein
MAVRDSRLAYNQPCRVGSCALQSEGRIILFKVTLLSSGYIFIPTTV